jgi:hypothetical protein
MQLSLMLINFSLQEHLLFNKLLLSLQLRHVSLYVWQVKHKSVHFSQIKFTDTKYPKGQVLIQSF